MDKQKLNELKGKIIILISQFGGFAVGAKILGETLSKIDEELDRISKL